MVRMSQRLMLVPCLLLALVAGRSDGVEARGSQAARPSPARTTAAITIDYPAEGSIFPPEITPPTFLWHDGGKGVTSWRIDVSFGSGQATIHATSKGERLRIGRIDPDCVADTNEPPRLTPQLAAAHSWTPDPLTWQTIKRHSVASAATVTITGFRGEAPEQAVSRGKVGIRTSSDAGGRAHLLSRRAADAFGVGERRDQTAGCGGDPAGRLESSQRGRSPQPGGDGKPAAVRQLPFVLRRTARRWEWIWMACRATAGCTSWRRLRPKWRSASKT